MKWSENEKKTKGKEKRIHLKNIQNSKRRIPRPKEIKGDVNKGNENEKEENKREKKRKWTHLKTDRRAEPKKVGAGIFFRIQIINFRCAVVAQIKLDIYEIRYIEIFSIYRIFWLERMVPIYRIFAPDSQRFPFPSFNYYLILYINFII